MKVVQYQPANTITELTVFLVKANLGYINNGVKAYLLIPEKAELSSRKPEIHKPEAAATGASRLCNENELKPSLAEACNDRLKISQWLAEKPTTLLNKLHEEMTVLARKQYWLKCRRHLLSCLKYGES